MSIRSYKDYFHGAAVRHKVLLHNPASDAPDGPLGGKRFTLFTQEEVISGLRTDIPETAVLHLHLYELQLRDNQAGDERGNYTAAFMVTQYAATNDIDAQVTAWEACEQIAEDIIDFMKLDIQSMGCSFPLGIIDWNSLDLSLVGPLFNGRFGCYVQFRYQKQRNAYASEARVSAAFNPVDGRIFEKQFDTVFE